MRFIPISDFEKDSGLTFRPIEDFEVRDTGDDAERLATRYKAPEPLPPEPQGLISRAFDAVKGTVSSIPAALAEKVTPYKSVMETYQPTVQEQQAELNKRLSYGAGPVSLQTVAKADEMRRGMIPIEQGPVLTVAKAREQAKETSFFDLVDKAKEAETFESDTETLRRQRVAEESPLTSAFAAGAASTLTGVINIPTVAAQLFNEYTVNPLLQLAGLKPLPKTDVMFGTEYLTKTAADYMPKINSRSSAGAIAREEFGKWLGVKLAANSQSAASSMAALFVPALRATLIPTMSSTAAGQSYAGGEPAMIAAAKGLIEAGTEMLPLKFFDKIGDALKSMSPLKQSSVLAVANQRLLQAGGQVTAVNLVNAIEETAAQFGGNVLDKYFQGKDIELTKGLQDAAIVGAVSGSIISSPQTAGILTGRYEPQNQIAQAINENVANIQFTGIDELARQQLSPFSNAPTNLNIGKINVEPVDTSTIFTATDASSAAAAAAELAGGIPTVNLPPINLQPLNLPGQIEPALTGLALPPLPPAVEPALTDLALPPLPPSIEPALDLNAPLQPDVATEQQFGLDKLRLTPPRPQKIQGQPVTSLTDDQLTTIAGDETIPAITRRSASVELTARQNEAAGTTLATGLTNAPSVTLANAPTEQNAGTIADKTLVIPESQVPSTAIAPVGGESAAVGARATAQAAIDRWATANGVETPAVFNAAPAELDSAVNQIGEALNSQFGGKLYAYIDPRPNSLNGVAIGGAAFVNTANVDVNVARTSIHEFHHTVEQIAKLEARQGLVDTPAQQYVASVNTVFDDMTEDGKRSYLVKFLNAEELAGITDPVAKEQRIQDLMASPTTRSEMVADFLGNRSTDKEFWKDLAATDPKGFKGFVDKWLGIVDNMLSVLKGTPTQGQKESALVDTYIRDLGKAKVIARDALIAYSKGTLNADTTGTQGIPQLAASNRQLAGGDGGGQAPEYGTARQGAVSVVAQHFSTQPRTSLNGAYYGTGLKGAERDRLDSSPDPRLKNRVYFYVDQGSGVRPEAGVGGIAHEAKLNNIYDPETKLIPPKGSFNAFESAVINAGFDGYLAPFGNNQSAVVLLGPRHSAVPVRSLGRVAGAPAPTPAEPTTLKKGLLSKELAVIEASRVPGARVAGGNLEIPVASRDAANAEMERIGSSVRFSEKQAEPVEEKPTDLGTFRDVADALGLSKEQYDASVLGLMTGKTKSDAFDAPTVGGIPEVVQWLDQRYRDAGMPVLDLNKAEDRSTLARMLAAEAVGAIRSAGNAVEWYDETVAKTLRVMAVKYPELNTDPDARNAFLMAVAISSQTMNVEDNLRYASNQYDAFRETLRKTGTGAFPEVGTGKSAPAMAKNFALANRLLKELGAADLRRFLQTELTKRDLEGMGFSIGGESMGETVLGSAVFGPKIGFGFYSNLTGNFEPVTMDMWFMRTIGRLSGTLPAFDPVLFPKQVAKLRFALGETGSSAEGVYAADFSPEDVAAARQTDEGAIALARKVFSLHNRQFIKERAKFDAGTRKKTALVGAAGAILKSADKPTDAPASGGERQRLRDVVRQMVDLVEEQTGKRVPPAALQALIWYPEQELYKKLGVRLRVTSQDYAGAAQSLLKKEGFDAKRINTAAKSGSRPARQVAGKQNAAATGPVGGAGQRLGPFQGQERADLIRARTEKTLDSRANAMPLVDLFTKLEGRGLAKTNVESVIARRSDAAQIQYMQDNFLDILDELDTAGLVEINCK